MIDSAKEIYKRPTLRKSLLFQQRDSHGGTIVNVITALIVLGLLGIGIWWLIKSLGQAGQQYSDDLVVAK